MLPGMSETRRVRRGAERLLLLAALLLGLVTMHTLGHEPLGHGAAAPMTAMAPMPMARATTADHGHVGRHAGPDAPARRSGDSGGPLAVCLAVLGALVVVLGGAALRRARRAGWARLRAAGVRWGAGRRAPPLPTTVLDRVAVLRI